MHTFRNLCGRTRFERVVAWGPLVTGTGLADRESGGLFVVCPQGRRRGRPPCLPILGGQPQGVVPAASPRAMSVGECFGAEQSQIGRLASSVGDTLGQTNNRSCETKPICRDREQGADEPKATWPMVRNRANSLPGWMVGTAHYKTNDRSCETKPISPSGRWCARHTLHEGQGCLVQNKAKSARRIRREWPRHTEG